MPYYQLNGKVSKVAVHTPKIPSLNASQMSPGTPHMNKTQKKNQESIKNKEGIKGGKETKLKKIKNLKWGQNHKKNTVTNNKDQSSETRKKKKYCSYPTWMEA